MNSDNWVDFSDRAADRLERHAAAMALYRMLSDPALATPMTLGVFGGWGTGKTSLMRTLQSMLSNARTLQLWFDSWIYTRQDEELWRALLLRVIEALRVYTIEPASDAPEAERAAFAAFWKNSNDRKAAQAKLDEARASLYRSMTTVEKGGLRVNWTGAAPLVADAALSALTAGLSRHIARALGGDDDDGVVGTMLKWFDGDNKKKVVELIEREATQHYVEQVTSLEQFQATLRSMLELFGIGDGVGKRRLLIFVDDLDRCLPENAVAALEAIKLFLDFPGCVFVLGMDRTVVEQGIRVRYRDLEAVGFDAAAYLDKIIQVPFNLPPLGSSQIDRFLDSLSAQTELAPARNLVRIAAPANPRSLKRVLNALRLALYLADASDPAAAVEAGGMALEPDTRTRYLTKLVLLQICFTPAWRCVSEETVGLKDLESHIRQPSAAARQQLIDLQRSCGPRMDPLFREEPFFAALSDPHLGGLVTLTQIALGSGSSPRS